MKTSITGIRLWVRRMGRAVALAGVLMSATAAHAATVWYNTDNNFNATNGNYLISVLLTGSCGSTLACTNGITSFGIFSPGNTTLNPASGYLPVNAEKDTITFTQSGANWVLTNLAGNTFTLQGSNHFMLGATMSSNPGTGTWVTDSGYTTITSGSQYIVDFPTGILNPTKLEATDIAPVPLPATSWLLAVGLVEVAWIVRRRSPDRRRSLARQTHAAN
ncbi:MAG: hypothetical protein ACYCVY_09070 [Acidiferrobacteraceae bacterium]